MSSKIGIVTVLYNSEKVLDDFFESLATQSYKDFVLIVVNNNSPDKSLERTRELAKKADFETVIINNSDNYGVAKGNNLGIDKAIELKCDYVLLSNNDITLENNSIEVLMTEMAKNNASMSVPKIYFFGSDIIWMAGGHFDKKSGINIHRGCFRKDTGLYNSNEQIGFAPTCFMLLDIQVFQRVGRMDEDYFVYWDDTDFVYRALKSGETLWYFPKSIVHHKEGTSTGVMSDFSIFYQNRNFVYFALKNYNLIYAIYVIAFNVTLFCFGSISKLTLKKWTLGIQAYFAGVSLFMKNKKKRQTKE